MRLKPANPLFDLIEHLRAQWEEQGCWVPSNDFRNGAGALRASKAIGLRPGMTSVAAPAGFSRIQYTRKINKRVGTIRSSQK